MKVDSFTLRPIYIPGKEASIHIGQEAGWNSELDDLKKKKSLSLSGNRNPAT
jgi:hypothetical protein